MRLAPKPRSFVCALPLLLFGFSTVAATEQESLTAAESSVVRVSIVRTDEQGDHLESTGSGFVVAPGIIATNYHVVSDAVGREDETILVTAESASIRRLTGTLTVSWPEADLALLQVPASGLEPLTLGPASVSQTAVVRAVGYPGATCIALGCTPDEIVAASAPTATVGNVSNVGNKLPNGTLLPSLFHTAPTNPGNSGGPLVDECGRVIGVDSWVGRATIDSTGNLNVPSDLNIAIGVDGLRRFLRGNGVAFKEDLSPCTPTSPDAQKLVQAQVELAAARAALAHPAPPTVLSLLAASSSQILEAIVLTILVAVVGLGIWWTFGRRHLRSPIEVASGAEGPHKPGRSGVFPGAILAISGAIALIVGVIAIFHAVRMPPPAAVSQPLTLAPTPPLAGPPPYTGPPAQPVPEAPLAARVQLACSLAVAQSFNPLPDSANNFAIEPATGCVNSRTPYERTATGFTRVMLMDPTRTVSVMDLTADLATFRRRDFILSPDAYSQFRASAHWSGRPRCETSSAAILSRLREAAQPYIGGAPVRMTTWNCVRETH